MKKKSLRYELILDGAVRKYPNGREVCQSTEKGREEYFRRISLMANRQHWKCCLGGHAMKAATFEHLLGRGMGGAHRDDRIVDEHGKPMNGAACLSCNIEKGSKRA